MVTVRTWRTDRELVLFDGIENVCANVALPRGAAFERGEDDEYPVPVDVTGELRTSLLELEQVPAITIRKRSGEVIETDLVTDAIDLDAGAYLVEIATPLKLYLAFKGGACIRTDDRLRIDFDDERLIRVGARVPHERPRATVETGADVSDAFEAISTFGSALRTTSPERSYPSMRGHPPLIDVGGRLHIPSNVEPPDTDVTVHAPASYLHAAVAAPLIYYLGARVVPAQSPRVEVAGAPVTELRSGSAFADDCTDLLHRTLFLDCLARTTRGYDITLAERESVDDRVDVEWDRLAGLPAEERLHAYQQLPTEVIREALPAWDRRAYVVPNTRTIEALPFLAHDLVSVRRHRAYTGQGGPTGMTVAPDGGVDAGLARSRTRDQTRSSDPPGYPQVLDLGITSPIGLNRAFPAAFRNRLERDGQGEAISISVVCNDEQMSEEFEFAGSVYGSRDRFPAVVQRYEHLRVAELAEVLRRPGDYFHYIGHIDEEGFECRDGSLDVSHVEAAGVEAFFLNACDSVPQAMALIERGAIGGIATHHAIVNSGAIRLGETIAELLIHGFPLGVSLRLARSYNTIGHKYSVIGDPTLDIANTESGVPYRCAVEALGDGRFDLTVFTYLTPRGRQGSVSSFRLGEDTPYYLNPASRTFTVEVEELVEFLELEEVPVDVDGTLVWSTTCRERFLEGDGDTSSSR